MVIVVNESSGSGGDNDRGMCIAVKSCVAEVVVIEVVEEGESSSCRLVGYKSTPYFVASHPS